MLTPPTHLNRKFVFYFFYLNPSLTKSPFKKQFSSAFPKFTCTIFNSPSFLPLGFLTFLVVLFYLYTEPAFWNTHWFISYLLLPLRNDQLSKTVISKIAILKIILSKTVIPKTVISKIVISKTVSSKILLSKIVLSKMISSKVILSKVISLCLDYPTVVLFTECL